MPRPVPPSYIYIPVRDKTDDEVIKIEGSAIREG
jgi:hypothetical protein